VSFLWIVRIFTVLIAALYSAYYAPIERIAIYFGMAISRDGWGSMLERISIYAIYFTALLSVLLVFVAVPRHRWGSRLLAGCLFLMGFALLHRLEELFFTWHVGPIHFAIMGFIHTLAFSLPPFILAAVLWQPFVDDALRRARSARARTPNQALQPTAGPSEV
jgi:hypothetical protein